VFCGGLRTADHGRIANCLIFNTPLSYHKQIPYNFCGEKDSSGIYRRRYIVHTQFFNPNYALEAKRTNALVGFNPDLATLVFTQEIFLGSVKTLVLLSRCEAEKMLMHFLDQNSSDEKN
jgi:hypothetical protein